MESGRSGTVVAPGGGDRRPRSRGWGIVAAFAVTQTAGYGALYYSFAVLLDPMTVDLHASKAGVTGALTCAMLVSAAMAVPVGRWLDRHGGRALMTAGSSTAAGLLAAWSRVETLWQLYLVLIALGAAMAMVLYDAATPVIVSWFDPARRARALLCMIVVAGFASTIFMPFTGYLTERHGWRTALLVLAAVYAVLAVPLHGLVVRRPPVAAGEVRPAREQRRAAVRAARHDVRFWLLAVAFVAHATAMSATAIHLVGFLAAQGHPATFTATVAGLLGVLSVTGRLLLTGAQRRVALHSLVALIFLVQAVAALTLPFIAGTRGGAIVGVVAFGVGFGVASLATPVLLAERYGSVGYGGIAGTFAAPVTVARAVAPLGAAALYTAADGYLLVFVAIGVTCAVGAVAVTVKAGSPRPSDADDGHAHPDRAERRQHVTRRRRIF